MQAQNEIIWRDDDIGYAHTAHEGKEVMNQERIFYDFTRIDALFKKYRVKHTIAVIAKDLEKAQILCEYIKSNPHIDVQLHCWEHLHYPQHLDVFGSHLEKGINKIGMLFGKKPTVFYPPYNDVCQEMHTICKEYGLKLSHKKMSLDGYLRGYNADTINFHFWASECVDLEAALKKYTGK